MPDRKNILKNAYSIKMTSCWYDPGSQGSQVVKIMVKVLYMIIKSILFWYAVFIRIKEHKRDASLLPSAKRFYLFWLERAFQEAPLERIVSIFDMTECGVSNLVSVIELFLNINIFFILT